MPADTVQHRRDVEQLVRNMYPGCHPVFVREEGGALAFRISDEYGRLRTGFVRVYDWHRQRFTKTWLMRAVEQAPTSEPGFPRLPSGR